MSNSQLITEHLRVILGDDVSNDIVDYLLTMKEVEDYNDFMSNIVNRENKHHITAYEFIKGILFRENTKKTNKSKNKNRSNTESNNQDSSNSKVVESSNFTQKTTHKGKKKFQAIDAFKEKKKEKVGRQPCDCEGQEHDFMNNCLNCGRIHCIEEGAGPCFYCGEPITLMGEESSVNRKQKQGSVQQHKENKVFDDDNDYFKANAKKQSKEQKRNRVIALDFASRRVIETSEEDQKIRKKLLNDSMIHLKNAEKMFKNLQQSSELSNITETQNDLVDLLIQMRYKKPVGQEDIGNEDSSMPIIQYNTKVFDEELIANTDHGLCLSMHQPYASLLVAGVKKHEGRTWCTNHRGRLWIAAASKTPDDDEISALESFYRDYYDDATLKFPRNYPTSCLLGCVFVEDCLDQDTYRQRFPNGESNSPFVLICSNPIILPIFYPIVGKHKIYALDNDLHRIAKMSLRYAQYIS